MCSFTKRRKGLNSLALEILLEEEQLYYGLSVDAVQDENAYHMHDTLVPVAP